MFLNEQGTSDFFNRITARPALVLTVALVCLAVAALGLGRLVKDTSVKAFIPKDHPALIADEKVASIFGLSDTIAVAVTVPDGSVFSVETFEVIAALTASISELPNVRADRVTSLATESSISGSNSEIDVVPYIDLSLLDDTAANDSRLRWRSMPPHIGTIVSEDETSAIIMAELIDSDSADQTYASILEIAAGAETRGRQIRVAGPGAVSGYLSRYIDEDARKLQPLVFLLVLGFIFLAFRRISALPGPLLVVVGAAGGALGIMAWSGEAYYAITNALPVVIVAISVADAIHILSAYFQYRSQYPDAETRGLVVRAMTTMARPITLTTITTIAGFVGIGVTSIMPPITAFAWYAALGVALAWVFSILALPNMLVLMRLGPSPAFENWAHDRPSGMGRVLAHIGSFSAAHFRFVLASFAAISIVAVFGALQLEVDRSQVDNFAANEPIRVADEEINRLFAGTAFLDVVIESSVAEGLLDPESMRRIVSLQEYVEQLPYVQKAIGITDYLSLLHHAIEGHSADAVERRALPSAEDSIAQYLLVYEMSGDPTDFDEEIDYGYETALLRVILNTHYYSESRDTVVALQDYLTSQFNDSSLSATLAGDVTISYHWMNRLEQSHFLGVALSLALVLATSILVFRSVGAGVIAVIPVSFAVLVLYAFMGYMGIYLEPATSMFAAIALGVGVDFGIHLVERLKQAHAVHSDNTAAVVSTALPATARACFFNSAALGLGFSVLMFSNLPTLQRFGGLVALASVTSYLAALFIVPALYAAGNSIRHKLRESTRRLAGRTALATLLVIGSAFFYSHAEAASDKAIELARKVSERTEGDAVRSVIEMVLTNSRGHSKERSAIVLKKNTDDARYTRITYTSPKTIRDTSFLSHDFHDSATTDGRWLYMPSLRKVRRIPASDRGDYFLGTDFTYEDIQSELKFDLDDFVFEYAGQIAMNDHVRHRLNGNPRDAKLAKQLGYGRFEAVVDEATWMPVRIEFYDLAKERLKTIYVTGVKKIDNIWTATEISAVNHQTGHQTKFRFRDVVYLQQLEQQLFQTPALARGALATLGEAQ